MIEFPLEPAYYHHRNLRSVLGRMVAMFNQGQGWYGTYELLPRLCNMWGS